MRACRPTISAWAALGFAAQISGGRGSSVSTIDRGIRRNRARCTPRLAGDLNAYRFTSIYALGGSMIDHPSLREPHHIDVHYHILPPRYLAVEQVHDAIMGIVSGSLGQSAARQIVEGWTAANALEELDRNAIATGVSSIGAFGI